LAVRPNRKEWSSFNTPSSFRGHRRTRFSFISFSDKNFTILFSFVFQCSLQFCDAVLSYLPPSHFLAFFDVLSRAPSSERSGRLRTVPLFPPFIYFSCLAPPLLIRRVTLGSTFSGYWQISRREISLWGGGGRRRTISTANTVRVRVQGSHWASWWYEGTPCVSAVTGPRRRGGQTNFIDNCALLHGLTTKQNT